MRFRYPDHVTEAKLEMSTGKWRVTVRRHPGWFARWFLGSRPWDDGEYAVEYGTPVVGCSRRESMWLERELLGWSMVHRSLGP